MSEFEYDPERSLWRPGRRSFLFMFGAAIGGALVSRGAEVYPLLQAPIPPGPPPDFADLLVETFSRDRVFAPFERRQSLFYEKIKGTALPVDMVVDKRMPRDTIAFVEQPRRQGVAPKLRGVITGLEVPDDGS